MFGVHDQLAEENAQLKSINADQKANIETLKKHLELVQHDRDSIQAYRWHATYNAALTGMYSGGIEFTSAFTDSAHRIAKAAANLAHGELAK